MTPSLLSPLGVCGLLGSRLFLVEDRDQFLQLWGVLLSSHLQHHFHGATVGWVGGGAPPASSGLTPQATSSTTAAPTSSGGAAGGATTTSTPAQQQSSSSSSAVQNAAKDLAFLHLHAVLQAFLWRAGEGSSLSPGGNVVGSKRGPARWVETGTSSSNPFARGARGVAGAGGGVAGAVRKTETAAAATAASALLEFFPPTVTEKKGWEEINGAEEILIELEDLCAEREIQLAAAGAPVPLLTMSGGGGTSTSASGLFPQLGFFKAFARARGVLEGSVLHQHGRLVEKSRVLNSVGGLASTTPASAHSPSAVLGGGGPLSPVSTKNFFPQNLSPSVGAAGGSSPTFLHHHAGPPGAAGADLPLTEEQLRKQEAAVARIRGHLQSRKISGARAQQIRAQLEQAEKRLRLAKAARQSQGKTIAMEGSFGLGGAFGGVEELYEPVVERYSTSVYREVQKLVAQFYEDTSVFPALAGAVCLNHRLHELFFDAVVPEAGAALDPAREGDFFVAGAREAFPDLVAEVEGTIGGGGGPRGGTRMSSAEVLVGGSSSSPAGSRTSRRSPLRGGSSSKPSSPAASSPKRGKQSGGKLAEQSGGKPARANISSSARRPSSPSPVREGQHPAREGQHPAREGQHPAREGQHSMPDDFSPSRSAVGPLQRSVSGGDHHSRSDSKGTHKRAGTSPSQRPPLTLPLGTTTASPGAARSSRHQESASAHHTVRYYDETVQESCTRRVHNNRSTSSLRRSLRVAEAGPLCASVLYEIVASSTSAVAGNPSTIMS